MSRQSSSIHGWAFGSPLLGKDWSIETHEDAQARETERDEEKMHSSFFGSHGRTSSSFKVAIMQPECPESRSCSKTRQCPIRYSMPTTGRASRRAACAHGGRRKTLNTGGQPAILSCLDLTDEVFWPLILHAYRGATARSIVGTILSIHRRLTINSQRLSIDPA